MSHVQALRAAPSPNVLVFSMEPEENEKFSTRHYGTLAYCVALEKAGCNVKLASFSRNDAGLKHQKVGRDEYLAYEERRFKLAEAAPDDKEAQLLKQLIEEKKANPGRSFQIETGDDGDYIVFPAVKERIANFDGAVAWNASQKQLAELLRLDPEIIPMNHPDAIQTSMSKIAAQKKLENEGVPAPVTVCLPFEDTQDKSAVIAKLEEKGLSAPYIVKTDYGRAGTGVYCADTLGKAIDVIQKLGRAGKGVVVQETIDPDAAHPEWTRIVVVGDKICGTLKCIGEPGALPDHVETIINPRDDIANTRLHGPKTPCEISEGQARAAIEVGKAIGLRVFGIDMMSKEGQPVVLDVADCPDIKPHFVHGQTEITKVSAEHFIEEMRQKIAMYQGVTAARA